MKTQPSKLVQVRLIHHKTVDSKDRFLLDAFYADGSQENFSSGSSVLTLKVLARLDVGIPKIMTGPSCWDEEYTVRWNFSAPSNRKSKIKTRK